MKYLKFCVLAFVVFLFGTVQAEPTKEETIQFIETKVKSCGRIVSSLKDDTYSHISHITRRENSFAFLNEQMKTKEKIQKYILNTETYKYGVGNTRVYEARSFLSKLSPKLLTDKNKITVFCTAGNCFKTNEKVAYTSIKSDIPATFEDAEKDESPKESTASKQTYTFCDNLTAQKITKALSHLIKLSDGKKELF